MANEKQVYLAVDLGASSGRVLAGEFSGQSLVLEEVSRFDNGGVLASGRLYWNWLGLWQHIQDGLRAACSRYGDQILSVGVDTWGVDFGLLDARGELLGSPVHYRDRRTEGMMDEAFKTVSRAEIFEATGLQFMELNTLYQLMALRQTNPSMLESARSLLLMPDLFHWLLSGEVSNEYTDATTTQFFDPRKNVWALSLLNRFDLPTDFLGPITAPGTQLGCLRSSVVREINGHAMKVVLPGTHDTASAVMAVPALAETVDRPNWCYISSGTWSLMGVESPGPVVNEDCRELNFTNEGGVGGTIRLLKNIAGLWLVQQCRASWLRTGRELSWNDLTMAAGESAPLVSLIHPDDGRFVAPDDMPREIQEFCRETGQTVPETHGAVIRCALESLALRYRMVLGWLEQLVDARLETIHIVGGGTQNRLLCQMTADACARPIVAGPIEATAIGNVMMQAVSQGAVGSIAEARQVIRGSFEMVEYEPSDTAIWDDAYERFVRFST